jgi:hypothetical protein
MTIQEKVRSVYPSAIVLFAAGATPAGKNRYAIITGVPGYEEWLDEKAICKVPYWGHKGLLYLAGVDKTVNVQRISVWEVSAEKAWKGCWKEIEEDLISRLEM